MSDIVVIVSPAKAEEVRKKLFDFARAVFDRIVRGVIAMLVASCGFGAQSDLIKQSGDARP